MNDMIDYTYRYGFLIHRHGELMKNGDYKIEYCDVHMDSAKAPVFVGSYNECWEYAKQHRKLTGSIKWEMKQFISETYQSCGVPTEDAQIAIDVCYGTNPHAVYATLRQMAGQYTRRYIEGNNPSHRNTAKLYYRVANEYNKKFGGML